MGHPLKTLKFQRLSVDWQSKGQGFEPPILHQKKKPSNHWNFNGLGVYYFLVILHLM